MRYTKNKLKKHSSVGRYLAIYRYRFAWVVVSVMVSISFASSCQKLYKDPTVIDFYGVELLGQQDTSLSLKSWVVIDNPNNMKAVIKEVKSEIYIDTLFVGSSKSQQSFELKGKDTTHVPFDSNVALLAFSELFPSLLQMDSVELNVNGDFKVQLPVIKAVVNIHKEAKVKVECKARIAAYIQEMLEKESFSFKLPFKLKQAGLAKTSLVLDVEVENSFDFPYRLSELSLDIHLADGESPSGNWKLEKAVDIAAHESVILPMAVDIDNQAAFGQILGGFFNRKMVAHAKGSATVLVGGYAFKVPIEISKTPVDLLRN